MILYLENGQSLKGESCGAALKEPILSEIVFNTSMTGYQEIITDPSYCDQMVVMTFPLQGNYGINLKSSEALTPYLKAMIIKEVTYEVNHFQSQKSLPQFLKDFNVPAIAGVDTRYLTQEIRKRGTMKCLLSNVELSDAELKNAFSKNLPSKQISKVSTKEYHHFPGSGKRVVLFDFGYKKSILKSLLQRNADVVVVPFNTSFKEVMKFNPQGIVLSNGPGDPKDVPEVLPVISECQKHFPLLGICMGHQLLALANGLDTEKLKFGHRGANHPVKDLASNKIFLTSQNHGYAVVKKNLENSALKVTQVNLNDETIEGLRHKTLPVFSVQYHPEAAPGPQDTEWVFDQFLQMIDKDKNYAH